MLGASAPRSDQSEPGLAPVIIPLPALSSYWGVGGRKYTAPPNPQGDRPRSMRSLAINYRILPGSLDNTVRFSCLLLRSGDPWRGPSDWGLGTKDTQAHTSRSPFGIVVVYG